MRLSPQVGLSFAAMVVASSLVVSAQTPPVPAKPSPLAEAAQRQDKQAVQALLKKKADVNATQPDGATALHWAVYAEDAETTALLIRAGANVNVRNNYGVSPLSLAAKQANANILGQLMKAGADRTTRSTTSTPTRHR